jgi:hypothetical protein
MNAPLLRFGGLALPVTALFIGSALPSFGQSTISPTDRYAYAANAGWIDFRPSSADGVRVSETFMAGYAYAANFGWISFGNGVPVNGYAYANGNAADYGVNIAADGKLTGYAYAANVGWIQFEQSKGLPQVNPLTGQMSGYAYSANLGWISLKTSLTNLATTTLSRPDTDGDGIPDSWEMQHFGNLTTANATSDYDHDGSSDLSEYIAGTDPKDPLSRLKVITHSYDTGHTQATLTFTSAPNRTYRLEYDYDLAGVWTNSPLGTFNPDSGSTTTRTFTFPTGPKCFFRPVAMVPLP